MKIKNCYEEDGYKITKYKNGAIIKEFIGDIKQETEDITLSQDEFQSKVILDIEYLKCLAEINGGF